MLRRACPSARGAACWGKDFVVECCLCAMQGTPFCYRFRVPPNKDIVIKDKIRGDVKFNTNALGDFVILRSNGLPVYNFCVAIDDALMRITHVIRAVGLAMRLHLASLTLACVVVGISIPTHDLSMTNFS